MTGQARQQFVIGSETVARVTGAYPPVTSRHYPLYESTLGHRPMTSKHQLELDRTSELLARLELDNLLCVVTNALVHAAPSPLTLLTRLATVMITATHLFGDDDIKALAVSMLRDCADEYEHSLMTLKQLN